MARSPGWADLRIGLISVAAIVGIVLSILLFARVGDVRGETVPLYATASEAPGVLKGTEVWLAGEKIGLVKEVEFRPVSTDTAHRLAIEMEVLADKLPLIRRNSYADIRPGGNLIGSPIIYLSIGTANSPRLRSGDTIFTRQPGTFEAIGTRLSRGATEVSALVKSVKNVAAQAQSPRGTIGAFLKEGITAPGGMQPLNNLRTQAMHGDGTLGRFMRDGLPVSPGAVLARADSVMLLVSADGRGNVGRFRRDSTLFRDVQQIMADVDSLRARLSNPAGALARSRSDSALAQELARVRVEFDALLADMKKHPLRYLRF